LCFAEDAFAYRDASTLLDAVDPVAMSSSAIAFAIESNDGGMASSLRQEANRALAAWSAPECSSLSSRLGEVTIASVPAVEGDGINTIEWVEQDWTAHCTIDSSLGCTKVQYVQGTDGAWHIDEADIYLNAKALVDLGNAAIAGTLLHELGHALGLMHPCHLPGDPLDGSPVCDGTEAESVMLPTYEPEHAALAQDDLDGICWLYPRSAAPAEGQPEEMPSLSTGAGLSGDPCVSNEDCESGACAIESGFCSLPCVADGDCASGACEVEDGDTFGGCKPALSGLGQACGGPEDCAGNRCVSEVTESPVCTRDCSADCPPDWACRPVDGSDVCVPKRGVSSSGCSASGAVGSTGAGAAMLAVLLGCLSSRRKIGGWRLL